MVYKQGTLRAYTMKVDVLDGQKARSITGFGASPLKAREDASRQLTSEERLFAYLRWDVPKKVRASFKVPLADILTLKSCVVSDWEPDEE